MGQTVWRKSLNASDGQGKLKTRENWRKQTLPLKIFDAEINLLFIIIIIYYYFTLFKHRVLPLFSIWGKILLKFIKFPKTQLKVKDSQNYCRC